MTDGSLGLVSDTLPEIGHTGDSDIMNAFVSEPCYLSVCYGKRAEECLPSGSLGETSARWYNPVY